jgi:5-hydroxyisourate hydrolase
VSRISTEVVDTSTGGPADRMRVVLEARSGADEWEFRTRAVTDEAGRVDNLLPEGLNLKPGVYRVTFDTRDYFSHQGGDTFYPQVSVTFEIKNITDEVHIPLSLGPYGYSTFHK